MQTPRSSRNYDLKSWEIIYRSENGLKFTGLCGLLVKN